MVVEHRALDYGPVEGPAGSRDGVGVAQGAVSAVTQGGAAVGGGSSSGGAVSSDVLAQLLDRGQRLRAAITDALGRQRPAPEIARERTRVPPTREESPLSAGALEGLRGALGAAQAAGAATGGAGSAGGGLPWEEAAAEALVLDDPDALDDATLDALLKAAGPSPVCIAYPALAKVGAEGGQG